MLKVQNITKNFGSIQALSSVSFDADGGVLGIIGPKGMGKSTLLAIIAGVLEPNSGKVYIDEYDISEYPIEAKKNTGYLSEGNPLYEDMTLYEHLLFVGEAKRIPSERLHKQTNEALELLGIDEIKDVLIANTTQSERQLLGVAATLLGNPDIIVLDEPLKSVNETDAAKLSSIIKMLGTLKTVILSSEDVSCVAGICDKFLLISEEGAELIDAATIEAYNTKGTEDCEE